jgi:oxygen-independent coproporphyrinogen-3 oxidase
MFQRAATVMERAGYYQLGLDHFVLPEDELYMARQQKILHRNFQGYCTLRTTGQVYAFGVTGISQLDGAYAQNGKDIEEYIQNIQAGDLCIRKGYALSHAQRLVREVIEALMCNYHFSFRAIADHLGVTPNDVKDACHLDPSILQDMQNDGIITWDGDTLSMTDERSPFVRNVAACLDPLMVHTDRKFSKPI